MNIMREREYFAAAVESCANATEEPQVVVDASAYPSLYGHQVVPTCLWEGLGM